MDFPFIDVPESYIYLFPTVHAALFRPSVNWTDRELWISPLSSLLLGAQKTHPSSGSHGMTRDLALPQTSRRLSRGRDLA